MTKKITALTAIPAIDRTTDVLEIADVSASTSYKVTPNNLVGISGGSVVSTSDSQALTNKTITSPTISDPTFSGTLIGTYTIGGTPTFPSSVVTLTGSQTLTNKILTSPTINTATIANPTLTTDTVSEYTGANGVAVDGLNIKDGKLNTNNSVVTTNITNDAVTATKIDWATTGADGGIWWEELGRTTLGSGADTISVSSFSARKYLRFSTSLIPTGGTISTNITFNGDTGSNYARRYSTNGAADTTATSQASLLLNNAATSAPFHGNYSVMNMLAQVKLLAGLSVQDDTAGAGTAPDKYEVTGKWVNSVAQITTITLTNTGTGDYATGSEIVVLGHN